MAMLRTNAWFASAASFMRTRSPRMAPPENGLLGSTATTPTLWPSSVSALIKEATSVDLPAPGTPVMPMMCALPVCL